MRQLPAHLALRYCTIPSHTGHLHSQFASGLPHLLLKPVSLKHMLPRLALTAVNVDPEVQSLVANPDFHDLRGTCGMQLHVCMDSCLGPASADGEPNKHYTHHGSIRCRFQHSKGSWNSVLLLLMSSAEERRIAVQAQEKYLQHPHHEGLRCDSEGPQGDLNHGAYQGKQSKHHPTQCAAAGLGRPMQVQHCHSPT